MRISELILDDKNEIDGIVGTINLISKKNINKKGNIIKEKKKIKEILKKFKNKIDFIISQKRKNEFVFEMIFDSKNRLDIEILDKNKLNAIIDKMRNKMGNIGYDLNFNENKEKIEIFFKLKFFSTGMVNDILNISLSEKVIKKMKDKNFDTSTEKIIDNFIFKNEEKNFYIYSIYKNSNEASKELKDFFIKNTGNEKDYDDTKISNSEKNMDKEENENIKVITLFGEKYFFNLSLKKEGDVQYLSAEEIGIQKRKVERYFLGKEGLKFIDLEEQKKIENEKIAKLLQEREGYLKLWEKYSEIESEFLFQKARDIGIFEIEDTNNFEQSNPKIRVVSDNWRKLSIGDRLLFSDEEPPYIKDSELTWKDYKKIEKRNYPTYEIKNIENGIITLDIKGKIDTDKIVTYSIIGDQKQIERKEKARELINNMKSANPNIGIIIEGMTESLKLEDRKKFNKIEPLSFFVKNKIFKNEPTFAQKKAIEIALNTPDIAIIQGPPGTGKTTVITAIIERLNEIQDKSQKINGKVLITSFQHDAVRNIIERLTVNSLPTIKFGLQNDDDETMDKLIDNWSEEIIQKLRKKNPIIKLEDETQKLDNLYNTYFANPTSFNEIELLKFIKKINLEKKYNNKIDILINNLQMKDYEGGNKLLPLVRALRTTENSFEDDGEEKILDLIDKYEEILEKIGNESIYQLNKSKLDFLKNFIGINKSNLELEKEIKKLKEFKQKLLDEIIPKPYYKEPKHNIEVIELYNLIRSNIRKPENSKEEILFDFLNELENNRENIKTLIKNYSFVYASTTQQSLGKEIREAKKIEKQERLENPEYDTVIVDEAARVNPGDLLIPISQAKNKLILVGDHKQLPHIYDEEVFEELEKNNNIENSKYYIEKSMFENLWGKAKELEKKDGIKRTITLDKQYRMHPLLGNFISNSFYKKDGEEFRSPRSSEEFPQPLYNVPLVWIEFNQTENEKTREKKVGTTRIRECEANYIVEEIFRMILNEGKNLSYGVITFYRGQVEDIKRKLNKRKKNMNLSKEIEEKIDNIRVGSVDAFQGMEFDVIFLSVVRSYNKEKNLRNKIEILEGLEENTKEYTIQKNKIGREIYGFITSEQRLCVALSRQKKLLIVVGNSDIFVSENWNNISEIFIPAMKNLYKLAEREGEIKNGY